MPLPRTPRSRWVVACSIVVLTALAAVAVASIGRERASRAALDAIRARPGSLALTISLMPPSGSAWDPDVELRSLLLHGGDVLVEPHGYWAETGHPVSADTTLTDRQVLELAGHLDRAGFFEGAKSRYAHADGPHARFELRVSPADGDPPLLFSQVDSWSPALLRRLDDLRAPLGPDKVAALDAMRAQLRNHFGAGVLRDGPPSPRPIQ